MLIKRVGYYLVGLSIGSIAVFFFWQKKDATFDYGMDARTLKTIRVRKRLFSETAKKSMQQFHIDTLKISTILYNGDATEYINQIFGSPEQYTETFPLIKQNTAFLYMQLKLWTVLYCS